MVINLKTRRLIVHIIFVVFVGHRHFQEIPTQAGVVLQLLNNTANNTATVDLARKAKNSNDTILGWVGRTQKQSIDVYRWDIIPVGGFRYFLFSPLLGEDSHFD